MQTSALAFVGCALTIGCRRELPSITPEATVETNLVVAAHDHTFVTVASLRVPRGYHLDQIGALSFSLHRGHWEPEIGVNTAVSSDVKHEPDSTGFDHCDGTGSYVDKLVSSQPRDGGRAIVCEKRLDDGSLVGRYVVRDMTWRGHEFQAWVSFPVFEKADEAYDEGKPSEARIADAISIVDSLQIRPMALEECPKYFKAVRDLKDCPERE